MNEANATRRSADGPADEYAFRSGGEKLTSKWRMNMENKIEIHNESAYGDFALHDINLDIRRREITAFIGPSGCGKSTLHCVRLNRMNDLVEKLPYHGRYA